MLQEMYFIWIPEYKIKYDAGNESVSPIPLGESMYIINMKLKLCWVTIFLSALSLTELHMQS